MGETARGAGAGAAVDWAAVRAEFPALAHWTYLNSATFGQLPRRGVEAVAAHFAHRDELACADFLAWFDDMDRIRGKVARLVNAAADDVCFVPTAAHGLSLVANAIDWKPGDRLVTLAEEFPNYLYMPALVELHLDTGTITDKGIDTLAAMTRLKHLNLYHTLVTEAGQRRLAEALPNCRIVFDRESALPTRRGS